MCFCCLAKKTDSALVIIAVTVLISWCMLGWREAYLELHVDKYFNEGQHHKTNKDLLILWGTDVDTGTETNKSKGSLQDH